jgi:glyoxylase-like metal-dependent hydrolase (beta-lactamase superfamily II)
MAKISLNHIRGNSYYCNGIFSIGVYVQDKVAFLIDSGSDERSAKDAYEAIQELGYTIGAIINTHCHPDHCGGNSFFQKNVPTLKIFSAVAEKAFIEDPSVAPRCFCGGAAPFAGLKNKHIAPQNSSIVTDTITPYQDQVIKILGTEFNIVTLQGHTPGMVGVITPDNVLYCGDALFGEETLCKHPILFYTDIEKTLETFKKLAALSVDTCVLYHGGVVHNLATVAKQHEEKILDTQAAIFSLLQQESLSIDILTQKIMQAYNIADNMVSFILTQTTIRAYLTHLEKLKKITLTVRDGLLKAFIIRNLL